MHFVERDGVFRFGDEQVEVSKPVVPKERVRLDKDTVLKRNGARRLRKERIDVEYEGRPQR